MNYLYDCSCDSCNATISLSANGESPLFKAVLTGFESAVKQLLKNTAYKPEDILQYTELIDATNNVFKDALSKGIKDNVIPGAMKTALENDTFLFSALKTHAQLLEASRLLLDDDGKVKSFQIFSNDVAKIKADYNQTYLEAEYQFATTSAQMAAKWADVEENEDRYNIQYRTAGDDRVRDAHALLNGITLPASNPFWKNYYPPNGWRCRCNALEVLKDKYAESDSKDAEKKGEKATSELDKDNNNRLAIFRFNPGQQKVIFPPKHPYSKVQGATVIKTKLNDKKIKEIIPYKPKVKILPGVDKKSSDYNTVNESARYFSKMGRKAEILPRFNGGSKTKQYQSVFSDLTGTEYEGKCPDLRIDGIYYEHEGFNTKNPKKAFKNMLNGGQKQASHLVIEDCGLDESYMVRNIKTRVFVEQQKIEEVWLKTGKNLKLIYKNAKTP